MRRQHRLHQNAGTATPDAGLDQITLDLLFQHGFDRHLQIVEPLHPDHRIGVGGPDLTAPPLPQGHRAVDHDPVIPPPQQLVQRAEHQPLEPRLLVAEEGQIDRRFRPEAEGQGLLDEVEVKVARLSHLWSGA